MEMSSSLIGTLPIEDMVAHYSRLFTNARWQKTEELKASRMAMMTFETTTNGERWHCAFSINIGAPNTADVRLSLRRF